MILLALALALSAGVGATLRQRVRLRAGTARPVRRMVRGHIEGRRALSLGDR